jgi:hypothetical protein
VNNFQVPIFRAFSATCSNSNQFRKKASLQNGRYRKRADTRAFGVFWVYAWGMALVLVGLILGVLLAVLGVLLFGEDC